MLMSTRPTSSGSRDLSNTKIGHQHLQCSRIYILARISSCKQHVANSTCWDGLSNLPLALNISINKLAGSASKRTQHRREDDERIEEWLRWQCSSKTHDLAGYPQQAWAQLPLWRCIVQSGTQGVGSKTIHAKSCTEKAWLGAASVPLWDNWNASK